MAFRYERHRTRWNRSAVGGARPKRSGGPRAAAILAFARNWRVAPRGKLPPRRVSIVPGARRKKSHADGSLLFQWLEHGCWTKQFQSAPPPGTRRKAKASWSSRAKPGRTRAGRAAKNATESLARSRPVFACKKLRNGKAHDLVSGRQPEKNGGAIGAGPGSRAGRRSGSFRIEEHDVAGSSICASGCNSSRAERANRSPHVTSGSWATPISALTVSRPLRSGFLGLAALV